MGRIFYELKEERGGFMKRIYKVYKKTVSIVNETPTAMYENLVGSRKGFLLESYDKNYDRYTFLGEPEELITSEGESLVITKKSGEREVRRGNPLALLKEYYDEWDDIDEQIRAQYTDLNVVLEGDMLCKVDRASMLASLETRVPFLDTEIVETAFNLPSKFKIDKTQRKIILRDTFRDFIPEEINRASKKGFSVPIGEWLEKELKYDFGQYLKKDFLQEQGIFNESYIHDIWNAHLRHKENNYSKLWCFYVFQVWYDRYILNGN